MQVVVGREPHFKNVFIKGENPVEPIAKKYCPVDGYQPRFCSAVPSF